jgi:hypothetical protein
MQGRKTQRAGALNVELSIILEPRERGLSSLHTRNIWRLLFPQPQQFERRVERTSWI